MTWHQACQYSYGLTSMYAKFCKHQPCTFKGIIMKKTVLASTIALAFGLCGGVMAQPHHHQSAGTDVHVHSDNGATANDESMAANDSMNDSSRNQNNSDGDAKARGTGTVAANNGATASSVLRDSFNTSDAFNTNKVMAMSKLDGSVSHNKVENIGNVATNKGSADGGTGKGGTGTGGLARSNGGDSGRAVGGEGGATEVDDMASGDDFEGRRNRSGSNTARQTGGAGGDANSGRGGDATADAGNGRGTGGTGGSAGTIRVTTGTFDISNTMTRVGQSAAGIMLASQNTGMSALVQQNVTVQANTR